jgi:hypothetical protein
MEGTVQLKYSVDGGATWSAQTAVKLTRCHAWIRPVPLDDFPQQTMGDYTLCYKAVARLVVSMQCDVRQFDPSDPNGNALYLFVNKLRAAPLIHLYYNGSSIDGFDSFAASNNTNYLVPDDTPDVAFIATDGTRLRDVRFSLVMQKEYPIAP